MEKGEESGEQIPQAQPGLKGPAFLSWVNLYHYYCTQCYIASLVTVWLTSPLTKEGQYFGKRFVLRCSAEKLPSVGEKIR